MSGGPHTEGLPTVGRPETVLYRAYAAARSVLRWILAAGFFFPVCTLLVLLGIFVDPRHNDWPQRWMSRTVVRLAGARVEVRCSPGFDPHRTCFFISNHVNLFDPWVLYSAVPQFLRGLELESHFRIPVYGWMMKRFGNVPVPNTSRPSDLKRMWRLTRAALDGGVSLVVFPEGSRTLTGRVGPFQNGGFRMALQLGAPIVPVSIVGAFAFNRKTSWMLRPGTIVVHLHDAIETANLDRHSAEALRDRVWQIVAAPVHAALDAEKDAEAAPAAHGKS
jgi:1-acyl-sn-glycerol-3-phosphate acyltransferase